MAPDVDLAVIAGKIEGYSGADITNVCRYVRKQLNVCTRNVSKSLKTPIYLLKSEEIGRAHV